VFASIFRAYNTWIIRLGLLGLKQRSFDSMKRVDVVSLLSKNVLNGSVRIRSGLMLSWMCTVSRKCAVQYYIVTLVTHLPSSSALSAFMYLIDNLRLQMTSLLQEQKLKLKCFFFRSLFPLPAAAKHEVYFRCEDFINLRFFFLDLRSSKISGLFQL